MSTKATPEQALAAARVLWPEVVAITDSGDKSKAWPVVPRWVDRAGRWLNLPTTDGNFSRRLDSDNIDWSVRPASERIVTAEIVPTDEDACRRVKVVVRSHTYEEWSEPLTLLAVVDGPPNKFVAGSRCGLVVHRAFCRLAHPHEIASEVHP